MDEWGNIITNERILHGNMDYSVDGRGRISSAQVKNGSLLNRYIERRILDEQHGHVGRVFFDMKMAITRPVRCKVQDVGSIRGMGGEGCDLATAYLLVVRKLKGLQERLINEALYDENQPFDTCMFPKPPIDGRRPHDYVEAFEACGVAIREAFEELRRRAENACVD